MRTAIHGGWVQVSPPRAGRVVVGVSDSLTGLRALREGTKEAQRRRSELCVVRAFSSRQNTIGSDYSGLGATDGRPRACTAYDEWDTRREEAHRVITVAFDDAMGGPPGDVYLRMVTLDGLPARTLVRYASRDEDLLVVGASPRRRRRSFQRSIDRYCTVRAACPVLVVPPHEAARALAGKRRRWHGLQKIVDEDTVTWSDR